MGNMTIYEAYREVPDNAKKLIKGGHINGFTDISPMWRIKCLTEAFGPCGIGWYPEITDQWIEPGPDGKQAAFCNINLYIKMGDEWSKPIAGTGGSCFVNIFKGSPVTSDEAYKMAYTDAISVACKCLGIGADVYWAADHTKYDPPEQNQDQTVQQTPEPAPPETIGKNMANALRGVFANNGIDEQKVIKAYHIACLEDLTLKSHNTIIKKIDKVKEACPIEQIDSDGEINQGSGDPVQPGRKPDGNSPVQSCSRPAV
jgi:hypothetical protein|nr:MAG TPA: Rad52/22 family double-strand break repair protein [Caudoviricetes sp.]